MSLIITNLHTAIGGNDILKGLSLEVSPGEVHVIMGPNGSGKSTLAKVITGHKDYEVTGGSVSMDGQDLFKLEIDERSRAGLFLAFQYPAEVPGVTMANFMRRPPGASSGGRGDRCGGLLQGTLREDGPTGN